MSPFCLHQVHSGMHDTQAAKVCCWHQGLHFVKRRTSHNAKNILLMTTISANTNLGHKIRRIRELKGIKQETLAAEIGVSRQTVSKMEQSEAVDEEMLDRVAKALGVPADAIKGFNEDAIINIISSTLHNTSGLVNYFPAFSFNPVDKLVDLFEENKNLYERMLETERSKVKLLEDLLKSKA